MSLSAFSSVRVVHAVAPPPSDVVVSLRTWRCLEQNLANGDLTAAQAAFNTYHLLHQIGATARDLSTDAQFAAKLAALRVALKSGCLSSAQSAFATVHSTLNSLLRPLSVNLEGAEAHAVQ